MDAGIFYSDLRVISDIYLMALIDLRTKSCPFCAETIQAAAVKCRFCGEFLNTDKARALEPDPDTDQQSSEEEEGDDGVLFAGSPSLFGMAPAIVKGLFIVALAWLFLKFPVENTVIKFLNLKLTETQILATGSYRVLTAFGLIAVVALGLLLKALKLKMIHYEVSADRIEYSRGILDRRVDNIDMFRVVDLKMRRSLLDCVFGIGTVALVTTDKTDPQFIFEKVRYCRDLYDIIKKSSLEADRKTGVVHLE